MHIAVNITLQDKATGHPWKIKTLDATTVHLVEETGDEGDRHIPRANVIELFEEFGPNDGRSDDPEDFIHLERCPFCGSTYVDPEGWMNNADVDNTGPECNDCGATAASVEAWNKRTMPEPAACMLFHESGAVDVSHMKEFKPKGKAYYLYPVEPDKS